MNCSVFYEANERPRHATATVAIRSKPIAPVEEPVKDSVGTAEQVNCGRAL